MTKQDTLDGSAILAEMVEGLEGVPGGEWSAWPHDFTVRSSEIEIIGNEANKMVVAVCSTGDHASHTVRYLAWCSPDNIFAISEAMGSKDRRIADLEAQVAAYGRALYPTAETKCRHISEHEFSVVSGFDEDGNEIILDVTVPWITVKEILKAASRQALNGGKADG